MPTAQEIIDRVRDELLTAGAEKIAQRRKTIMRLAETREKWPGVTWPLRSREGMRFTIDQSLMLKAHKSLSLKLLVLGHHVATLKFFPDDKRSPEVSVRRDEVVGYGIAAPEEPLQWSGNDKHAALLRTFIASCTDKLPAHTSELQVQLQLVHRLRGPKADDEEITNLQPVMPFGFPTEIATVVDGGGNTATGNMDILARTGHGHRGQFVVLELKKPKLSKNDVAAAFAQAIGYAAALTFEANGFDQGQPIAEVVHYRRLFSSRRRAGADYTNKPLVVHAAVVLHEESRDDAKRVLDALDLEKAPPQARGRRVEVGALVYDATQDAKMWRLGDVEWLRHAGSWRP
jgi:hypothetical protein